MDIKVIPVSEKMESLPKLMVNINDLPKSLLDDILNNIKLNEYESLDRLIDVYLQWKGIHGFSKDIIEMIKQSFNAKIKTEKEFKNIN